MYVVVFVNRLAAIYKPHKRFITGREKKQQPNQNKTKPIRLIRLSWFVFIARFDKCECMNVKRVDGKKKKWLTCRNEI